MAQTCLNGRLNLIIRGAAMAGGRHNSQLHQPAGQGQGSRQFWGVTHYPDNIVIVE